MVNVGCNFRKLGVISSSHALTQSVLYIFFHLLLLSDRIAFPAVVELLNSVHITVDHCDSNSKRKPIHLRLRKRFGI